MTHVTCMLTAKNRDHQLRNHTPGNRVWATFFVNKSVFSLVSSAVTWHCTRLLLNAVLRRRCCCWSMRPAREALSSKPAARRSGCRTTGQTDRRTDARPLAYIRPCSTYYAGSVSKTKISGAFYKRWRCACTHPLRTPRMRLSMKNDPRMMSETKYAHVKFVPTASFVCKTNLHCPRRRMPRKTKLSARESTQIVTLLYQPKQHTFLHRSVKHVSKFKDMPASYSHLT